MTRFCTSCRAHRPLREFDLGGGQLSTICTECADARIRSEDQRARNLRNAKIATLEQRHRELVAELVRIDAELVDLRPRARVTPLPRREEVPGVDDVFGSSDDRSTDELS